MIYKTLHKKLKIDQYEQMSGELHYHYPTGITCFILKYMSGELNYHYPPGITCFILKYMSGELNYHYPPGTTCFILKYISGELHYHWRVMVMQLTRHVFQYEVGGPGRVMVM
jgi:hypothetical protein